MSSKKKLPTRVEVETEVCSQAWQNPAFQKKILSNPKEALKELDLNILPSINVKVIKENPNEWYIVLKSAPENADDLSETQLKDMAAGGGSICIIM